MMNPSPRRPGRDSTVRAVERAISILKALSEREPELGVTTLSQRLGLGKSTVHRLLRALLHGGLVEQNTETEKYRLSIEILQLAGTVLRQMDDVQQVARPYLRALADACQETVNLTVLAGDGVLNVGRVPSPRMVRNIGWVGRRMPLHCVSAGKVFLALMPEAERERLLSRELVRFTERTITDPARLRKELEDVRRLGYSVGLEEMEVGLNAVAAPIRDHRGVVIAAISVSGPSFRITPEEIHSLAALTLQTANDISHHLGYSPESEVLVRADIAPEGGILP